MNRIAAFAFATVVTLMATPALAVISAPIDLAPTGTYFEAMGTLDTVGPKYNQSFISSSVFNVTPVDATFMGQLANNMKVTFTYTLSGDSSVAPSAIESLYSTLSSVGSSGVSSFTVTAVPGVLTPEMSGSVDGLVLASAGLSAEVNSGVTTLTNLTGKTIQFASHIVAILKSNGVAMNVTAAVSQVPLPAALPLFGLGIAALAGYRAKNRKETIKA